MNRLTGDLFEITELAHHGPEDMLISAATIIGALVVMFTVQWRLALLVLIMLPLFLLVVIFCRRRHDRIIRKGKAEDGGHKRRYRIHHIGNEDLQGI